ncbi:216_t:CDS:2 [Dentiscutata erythropus]|uniref:Non-homologous end-joining factor 1 n=1 Tax=Dentiscutata erythropus TaxID=1348616 RepID=A0A9N8YY95_9GLOM|nr:216_t:CDS:2 [Dentiscutata erythropus]
MPFTHNHSVELCSADWVVFKINDNIEPKSGEKTYLIKSIFKNDFYLVLVTDLRRVWFEELRGIAIIARAKEIETGLDTTDELQLPNLLTLLSELLKVQKQDSTYDFNLKTSINLGLASLRWLFSCEMISSSQESENLGINVLDGQSVLYQHFILPMMHVMLEYREQANILETMIKDKENEVSEVLELLNKAKSSNDDRKHKTEPFDEERLDQIAKNKIVLPVDYPNRIFSDSKTRLFFKNVTEKSISWSFMDQDVNQLTDLDSSFFSTKRIQSPSVPFNSQANSSIDVGQTSNSDVDDLAAWEVVESSQSTLQCETPDVKMSSEFKEIDLLGRELEKREQLKVMIKKDGMKRRKKKVW